MPRVTQSQHMASPNAKIGPVTTTASHMRPIAHSWLGSYGACKWSVLITTTGQATIGRAPTTREDTEV